MTVLHPACAFLHLLGLVTTGDGRGAMLQQQCPCMTLPEDHQQLLWNGRALPKHYGMGECRTWDYPGQGGMCEEDDNFAWCFQPWCYMRNSDSPCNRYPSQLSNGSLTLYWSYQACRGINLFNLKLFIIMQAPGDPFWDGIFSSVRDKLWLEGQEHRMFRPKDLMEETQAIYRILDVAEAEGIPFGDIVVIAARVMPGHCKTKSGCEPDQFGYNYEPLLLTEASLIFIEAGPLGNSSRWKKSPHIVIPDNYKGGQLIADEFCNHVHPVDGRKLVIFQGPVGNSVCEMRVQGFLDYVSTHCKETVRGIPLYQTANWDYWQAFTQMEALLAYQPDVDAVFACNDPMAMGATDASESTISNSRSSIFMGYDNRSDSESYLRQGSMIATIDQQLLWPNRGLAPTILALAPRLIDTASSTTSARIEEPNGIHLVTPIAVQVPNMEAHIQQQLLKYYTKNQPPTDNPVAEVSMAEAKVIAVDMDSQMMTVALRTLFRWIDPRLKWDCALFTSTISLQTAQLWVPEILIESMEVENLNLDPVEPLVHLRCNGEASIQRRLRATAACKFTEAMHYYPFDRHKCPIRWRSSDVELVDASNDVELVTFSMYILSLSPSEGWSANFNGRRHFRLSYPLTLDRQAESFYLNIVIPAFFLNVISFLQHWIPRSGSFDRAALGGTAVLSALTLQTAVQIPTHNLNLGITFLLTSLAFHFFSLVATVFGRKFSGNWDADFSHAVRRSVLTYLDERDEAQSPTRSEEVARRPTYRAASDERLASMAFSEKLLNFTVTKLSARMLGLWVEPVGDLVVKRLVIPLYLVFVCASTFMHAFHWSGRLYMWFFMLVPASWLLAAGCCFLHAMMFRGIHLGMLVGVHPRRRKPKNVFLEYVLPSFGDSRFRRDCLKQLGVYDVDDKGREDMSTLRAASRNTTRQTNVNAGLSEHFEENSDQPADDDIGCKERLGESTNEEQDWFDFVQSMSSNHVEPNQIEDLNKSQQKGFKL